jgi:bacterioferritin
MATNSRVVEVLNGLLSTELSAINQYFTHAKICESWGFERLAAKFREASMEEMRDAEAIMDRVLQLGGLPNLQRFEPFQVGEDVAEQLELALALETQAAAQVRDGVSTCEAEGDQGTSTLLRTMLLEEEEQLAWVESQVELMKTLGAANYLAQQVRE